MAGALPFTEANLSEICTDALRYYPTPVSATVDGKGLRGAKQLVTPVFTATVASTTGQLYQDSVDVGHPGKLRSIYCGWKAEVSLATGRHVIKVNYSPAAGPGQTKFTYKVNVLPKSSYGGY